MVLTSGKPGFPHVWHMPDLTDTERAKHYGRCVVEMAPVLIAGEYTTVTFQFTLGDTALPVGGRLRIAWRWPMDWHDLQSADPAGDGYVSAATDNAAVELATNFQQMGELDPWMHCLDVEVTAGMLAQGDVISLVCGDRSHGGRGWRALTCRVNAANFLLLCNPDNSDRWLRLGDPPSFAVAPGPAIRLVAVAPAEGVVGEPVDLRVRGGRSMGECRAFG